MVVCVNKIWEEFSGPLKKFISKRIPNEQDADDILQEVFLKIHSNINTLMDDQKIYSWIYRITRNVIVDYYRRSQRVIETDILSEELAIEQNEDLSSNAEIAICLKAMVDNMPENYKQAILLTEFQDMTQKELSEKLGISISGAKSRVQRARKMLKEMLLGCCHLDIDSRGNIIDFKHKKSDCKYC